ncbi:VWA domain-containing protein [Candidatus Woesebacteria bacterium]|nr:VWA domain-containing protein [Candidatus Woesebacteria bacterium]
MTELVNIVMVLDSSGSMQPLKSDTISAHNTFLSNQQEFKGQASYSLYMFSSGVSQSSTLPIEKAQPLNNFNYRPGGGTALYDAIGKAISLHVKSGTSGVLAILTDGEENSSILYNKEQVAAMIKDAEDIYGWEVMFLGANISNFTSFTSSLNIKADKAMMFTADSHGIAKSFGNISCSTTAYRTAKLGA